jgi:hypothetical protein
LLIVSLITCFFYFLGVNNKNKTRKLEKNKTRKKNYLFKRVEKMNSNLRKAEREKKLLQLFSVVGKKKIKTPSTVSTNNVQKKITISPSKRELEKEKIKEEAIKIKPNENEQQEQWTIKEFEFKSNNSVQELFVDELFTYRFNNWLSKGVPISSLTGECIFNIDISIFDQDIETIIVEQHNVNLFVSVVNQNGKIVFRRPKFLPSSSLAIEIINIDKMAVPKVIFTTDKKRNLSSTVRIIISTPL